MNRLKPLKQCLRPAMLAATFLAATWLSGCETTPLSDGLPADIACDTCHGKNGQAAPPNSLSGDTENNHLGVGAHQAHLQPGSVRSAISCSECHLVPATIAQAGHVDPLPAEVVFGPLAVAGGLQANWDRDAGRCNSTYCHGESLTGGAHTAPEWTRVDGSQKACDACHGNPPPTPHPQRNKCSACHPQTVLGNGRIDLAAGNHIDGSIDTGALACNGCHGSDDNAAPPVALDGSNDTDNPGVGAHQSHLTGGSMRTAIACEECHLVPAAPSDPGHTDSGLPAELSWGPLATADGQQPSWASDQASCANTYCHGASLSGGSQTVPVWTVVDGSQSACGTCHGNPPPPPHSASSNCSACHPQTVLPDGSIDVAAGHHIDGVKDSAAMACNSCHGNADNDAPPLSTTGSSDTNDLGVGTHQSHLVDGSIRQAVACDECHLVPTDPDDPAHRDGLPAELQFGSLAQNDGASPAWDRATATCTSTYCHGETLTIGGGLFNQPVWTDTTGTYRSCISCHGLPPPAPHPAANDCSLCHPGTVVSGVTIDVAGGQHIDGLRQFQVPNNMACDLCHAAPPATASHAVHYGASPADASYGGTEATADLLPGGNAYAFDCGNCHPTDPAQHANGVLNPGGGSAEIELDPSKAPLGSLKAKNPMNAAYTPGAQVFSDAQGLQYTQGTCSNVYCHSRKQFSTPGGVPEPGVDFAFNGYPIVYPAYTVDENRVYTSPTWGQSLNCDACHGFPPRSSVPDVTAGAGDSHSWIDGSDNESLHGWNMGFDPVACATCHYETVTDQGVRSRDPDKGWSIYQAVPIAGFDRHVNGWPNVTFTDELVSLRTEHDLNTAAWDPIAGTCSNTSCHLQENPVTWGEPYRYNNGAECNQCHQYRAEDVPVPASSRLRRNK